MKEILAGIRIKNKSEILPLCLQALAFQTKKNFDIFIYDESDVPVTDHYPVRLAMDHLQLHHQIDIHHQRRMESKNVADALIKLLDYTVDKKYDYLLMLDSDMILTPTCLEKMEWELKHSPTIYVEPTVIDINNALGHSDYSIKKYTSRELRKQPRWAKNHLYTKNSLHIPRTTTTASVPLIDFVHFKLHNEIDNKIDDIKRDLVKLQTKYPSGVGEDIVMYYHLTKDRKGMLYTGALAYHYSHTESQRDWYNISRQVQELITKGEL